MTRKTKKMPTDEAKKALGIPADATDVRVLCGLQTSNITWFENVQNAIASVTPPDPEPDPEPVKPKKQKTKPDAGESV